MTEGPSFPSRANSVACREIRVANRISEIGRVAALVDFVLNGLVDLGTRYWALRGDPAWAEVKGERMRRIEAAFDELTRLATRPTITRAGWCAPDIWLASAIVPERCVVSR